MRNWRWRAVVASALLVSACATRSPLARQLCANHDALLAGVLPRFEALRANGCGAGKISQEAAECDRLHREIERLAVVCPGHVPTLMANAVMAYDDRRPATSQQLLDQIRALSPNHPDASALRARIALEEGNLPFARRLLEQQIRLTPDSAALHETYAAVLYLERRWAEAGQQLTLAAALGAPRWRIAYHLGLIEEANGQLDEARRYYTEALAGNPGWAIAQSRLSGLGKAPAR